MTELIARRIWIGTFVFAGLFFMLLFMRLLPLTTGFVGWPGPDLGLCLTFAWLVRRPDHIPALLIAGLFLIEDIALYRPIGLWAAIVLLGSEAVRARESRWREAPFLVEWLRVSVLFGLMMLGYRFVAAIMLLPLAALGQVILQYLATILAYPLVVLGARWLVGLSRPAPGQAGLGRFGG
ncbi:rod shape-determining protein MreD [Paracoccus sp. TK19116]|uniref:Rod shape-determining protein MreD n=1 Tax=Paracoccus albicereus TaxID=2922394 RepID=A0ABT1MP76_9RHOB|nr:rod shape-determining protein MreD [Paracoccus albicereus]MCQ0970087.1 rod shape-determining protein MreD [Paracoccus albicereus]